MVPSIRTACKLRCLLGIETSGEFCSVAVDGEKGILKESLHLPYGQAGHLMGIIQDVLTEANVTWKTLTGVVVNRGPGSFTGLRVGLAAAEGIALAGNIPLFGLTGFEIYRGLIGKETNLLSLIDTRREDCFSAFFKEGALEPDFSKVMSYEEVDSFYKSRSSVRMVGNFNVPQWKELAMKPLEADNLLHSFSFYQREKRLSFPSDPYYLRDPEIHGKQASF